MAAAAVDDVADLTDTIGDIVDDLVKEGGEERHLKVCCGVLLGCVELCFFVLMKKVQEKRNDRYYTLSVRASVSMV